ncbi:conserved hypothetical protein [[Clostridium] ultunense Esp]|nr:conserved hypothetical protein [[Clostridium] ultunense Esp]
MDGRENRKDGKGGGKVYEKDKTEETPEMRKERVSI